MDIQQVKRRFGIIGNSPGLLRGIDIALQVAATDLSVLITGESGTGKEIFPQIIHQHSHRKHSKYIAVNCGAIPEGTIDSELFGHEKGAFTSAHESRKGYFEEADGGTIFLDEVGELPTSSQVRLLRVLETGEFIRVGSSKVLKTSVRVVAATNVKLEQAIRQGRFREDLFYRLSTVPISLPPLRERGHDILLLFRKFALDFADKYKMPSIEPSPEARDLLLAYKWPGNVRQLKNIAEQISVIEPEREISAAKLRQYIPFQQGENLPAIYHPQPANDPSFASEREILYKILFDMKQDVNDLKKLVFELLNNADRGQVSQEHAHLIRKIYAEEGPTLTDVRSSTQGDLNITKPGAFVARKPEPQDIVEDTEEIFEESLSLEDMEKEAITKALEKHVGKRKAAADELGISERTLYRKIKEYNIRAN